MVDDIQRGRSSVTERQKREAAAAFRQTYEKGHAMRHGQHKSTAPFQREIDDLLARAETPAKTAG